MQQWAEDSCAQINWGFWIFNCSGPNYGHQTVLLNTLSALSPHRSFPPSLFSLAADEASVRVYFSMPLIFDENGPGCISCSSPLRTWPPLWVPCFLSAACISRMTERNRKHRQMWCANSCSHTLVVRVRVLGVCVWERESWLVNYPCRLMLLDVEKQLGVSYNWADTNNESRYCLEALGNMLKILMPLIIQGLDRVRKDFFLTVRSGSENKEIRYKTPFRCATD